MQEERFPGRIDRAYSAWHRRQSIRRFIGIEHAQLLSMVDLDCALFVEYDDESREPLALIETARDVGQSQKVANVTKFLARRARIPAYVVLFRHSGKANPADPSAPDIDQFRLRRLWPKPEREWRTLTPEQWAVGLLRIRTWSTRRLDLEAANDAVYDTPTAPTARLEEPRAAWSMTG